MCDAVETRLAGWGGRIRTSASGICDDLLPLFAPHDSGRPNRARFLMRRFEQASPVTRHFADTRRSPRAEIAAESAIPSPCIRSPFWCLVFYGAPALLVAIDGLIFPRRSSAGISQRSTHPGLWSQILVILAQRGTVEGLWRQPSMPGALQRINCDVESQQSIEQGRLTIKMMLNETIA